MRNFILGTDWWTDCDDVVAMRVLTKAHKKGEINLCGIVLDACMEDSVRSLDGFLKLEGCNDIPLGVDEEATDFEGVPVYQRRLAPFSTRYTCNADAEVGVRLYRRILATSPEPVEILEIGFLQVLSALLESEGDDISEKTGMELVKEKVSKFWVMAGKWDGDGEKEHNFCNNARSRKAGKVFCEKCPVPVTFLGWEVGYDVITGRGLSHDDQLWITMADHGSPNGRNSWDPMLVLLAIIGDEGKAGYEVVKGRARVDESDGANYFTRSKDGKHAFVVKAKENAYYEKMIDSIIENR